MGAWVIAIASVPIVAWVGTAPLILMKAGKMNSLHYALWQIPIFISAIIGNIMVRYCVNYWPLNRICKIGSYITICGLLITFPLSWIFDYHYLPIITAISIYAFGLSFVTTTLNRLTLYATSVPKGTASALISVILMLTTAAGNYLADRVYNIGGNTSFSIFCAAFGIIYFFMYFGYEYFRMKATDNNLNFTLNILMR